MDEIEIVVEQETPKSKNSLLDKSLDEIVQEKRETLTQSRNPSNEPEKADRKIVHLRIPREQLDQILRQHNIDPKYYNVQMEAVLTKRRSIY